MPEQASAWQSYSGKIIRHYGAVARTGVKHNIVGQTAEHRDVETFLQTDNVSHKKVVKTICLVQSDVGCVGKEK